MSANIAEDEILKLLDVEKRKAPITVMGTLAPFFKYILKVIPEHKTWVEPFGGPCEVLFEKEVADKEVLNDIDSKNIGFFRALKSLSEKDIDWLEEQEWVRRKATFDKLKAMQKMTAREKVYRRVYMGACGLHMVKGEPDTYRTFFEGKPINVWRRLRFANKRLKKVTIHNEDFEKIVKKYDAPGTFFYCDPPFFSTEKYYSHALNEEGLERLIKVLKGVKGEFVCWNTACKQVIDAVKKAGFKYKILKKEAFIHRIDPTRKKWNYFIIFGNVPLDGRAKVGKSDWKNGFSIDQIKQLSKFYNEFDKPYIFGAFSKVGDVKIADSLRDKKIYTVKAGNAIKASAIVSTVAASRDIKDFSGFVAGRVNKGDVYISRFAYSAGNKSAMEKLIREHTSGAEVSWIETWKEDKEQDALAKALGYKYVGTKIKASSDMRAVWVKGASFPANVAQKAEDMGLEKLNIALDVSALKKAIESDRISSWADHYSHYNVRNSWKALSLRGYSGDPSFIAKPSEMSKDWKSKNANLLNASLQDTRLRKKFPEIEKIVKAIPGTPHRIRFMKLEAGGALSRHADITDPDAGVGPKKLLRIHVPIITNKNVTFEQWTTKGSKKVANMKEGEVWYLDTRKPHAAFNKGENDRIHLVIDMESNPELLSLLGIRTKSIVAKKLPSPGADESKKEFISRFMENGKVLEEFPDRSQRYAVAVSTWNSSINKAEPGSSEDDADQSQPALPEERRTGSRRNPKGSASTEGGKIELSDATNKALKNKLAAHNEKVGDDKTKRTTLRALQAVYRRGAGAFSSSHRPGMTRAQWAIARVNHFLHLLDTGKPKDPKYITDNDLLPEGHPAIAKAEGFIPPKSVRDEAAKGLELRRKWDRGGLSVQQAAEEGVGSGVQRAVNLKNGDRISLETISKMRGFFSRHQRNFKPDKKMPDGGPTAGTIAWYLWGGTPGRDWANKIWEEHKMNKADNQELPQHFGGGSNIDVFGYKTKHFDICRSAVMLFKKFLKSTDEVAQDHIVRAAKYLDKFFGLEKKVVAEGKAYDEDGELAIDLSVLFSYEVGIIAERLGKSFDRDIAFIKMHFHEIGVRMGDEYQKDPAPKEKIEKRLGLWGSTAGKTRVAKRIVEMIPDHEVYVEPFAGGAAAFYAKPKDMSKKEVLSDTNSELAFSLKFARDATEKQIEDLKKQNWTVSRGNLKKAHFMDPANDVERFYKFAYKRGASFFRVDRNITGIDPAKEGKKLSVPERIANTQERLKGVHVYNASYEKMLDKYDSKNTFFYLDPPYPRRTMEVGEREFDEESFIKRLKGIKGKFLLHYDYKDKKKFQGNGWNVKVISVYRTGGGGDATRAGKLLEVTNYAAYKKAESPENSSVSWEMPIMKVDEDERLVTGIVLEPNEIDAQNDTVSEEAIKEAAYKFVSRYNKGTQLGFMHKAFGELGISLVESWVARENSEFNSMKVKKGSWLMTVHVENDLLWKKIKNGDITGFSIGGVARVS